jgi:hypothetical protein
MNGCKNRKLMVKQEPHCIAIIGLSFHILRANLRNSPLILSLLVMLKNRQAHRRRRDKAVVC